jgi:dihydroorotate dehydrogenase/Pyruvate/2-oxoacid:ferredoxin oxidoreductase delta subunit
MSDRLETDFCGIRLKNPLVLGAGPLSGTEELIKRDIDAGFGAVLTKTASQFEYFHRYPYPIYSLVGYEYADRGQKYKDWAWFHNDHNSSIGPIEFAQKVISKVAGYAKEKDCLLVGTFAASTADEWVRCAVEYEKAGAGAIELNYCCPGVSALQDIIKEGDMTANYGDKLAENPEATFLITSKVRAAVKIPIICKIPPILRQKAGETAAHLLKAGANAVELYANNHGLRIDIENARPIGWGCGAVNTSGHLVETLHDIAHIAEQKIGIELLAGRGVRKWSDIVEMLMAGASAVEICTAVYVYGLPFVKSLLDDVAAFMERKGYGSIDVVRGRALPKLLKSSQMKDGVHPSCAQVTGKKCIGCGRCHDACVYGAVEMFYKNGAGMAKINRQICNGCTLCSQVCPASAISMEDRIIEDYIRAQYYGHSDSPELSIGLKELQ